MPLSPLVSFLSRFVTYLLTFPRIYIRTYIYIHPPTHTHTYTLHRYSTSHTSYVGCRRTLPRTQISVSVRVVVWGKVTRHRLANCGSSLPARAGMAKPPRPNQHLNQPLSEQHDQRKVPPHLPLTSSLECAKA
jgi:hypothetical protein